MSRIATPKVEFWRFEPGLYDDYKFQDLYERFGPLGEGIYFRILSLIAKNEGYWARFDDRLIRAIHASLGRWSKNLKFVADVISFCGECRLFDVRLLAGKIITSPGIQRRWLDTKKKQRARIPDHSKYWVLSQIETESILHFSYNFEDNCSNNSDNCNNKADNCNNYTDNCAQKVSRSKVPILTNQDISNSLPTDAGEIEKTDNQEQEQPETLCETQEVIPPCPVGEEINSADYLLVRALAGRVELNWGKDARIRKYGAELVDVAREYYAEVRDTQDVRNVIAWRNLIDDPAALERAFSGAQRKAGGSRQYLIAALNNNAQGL